MGYKKMTVEILQDIFRRWHCLQNITFISEAVNLDRKTIRKYIQQFKSAGYSPGCQLPDNPVLTEYFLSLIPVSRKKSPVTDQLLEHKSEIINLITDSKEPVKIKTAWKIITNKYRLNCIYEVFKAFTRKNNIKKSKH